MGLRKGQTNNKAGKPKGAVNKLNKDLRLSISDFLNNNFDEVIKEWKKLSGRDKVNFYKDILQYEVPKKQAVAVTGEINFKSLPESQLDQIADKLYNKK